MNITNLRGRRLLLVLVLTVVSVALFFPARQLMDQRGDIDDLEARLTALTEENERLEREARRLEDSAELEVEARERLGLVRPGERAYIVEPVEAPESPDEASSADPLIQRVWDWVVSLVRGGG